MKNQLNVLHNRKIAKAVAHVANSEESARRFFLLMLQKERLLSLPATDIRV